LWDCGEYCEDPKKKTDEIMEAWQKVKEAYHIFDRAVNTYNAIIPGKMERASQHNFRDYWRI
jgi:hypothetical protein